MQETRDPDRAHPEPHGRSTSEEWESGIGNGIVGLVVVLFAPLMTILIRGTATGLGDAISGLILIAGGGAALALGVAASSATRGRGLPAMLGVGSGVLGAIEIIIGLALVGGVFNGVPYGQ